MYNAFDDAAQARLVRQEQEGKRKHYTVLSSAQGPVAQVAGREVLVMSSNNYLGLANHPAVKQAAHEAIERFGVGTASVRFICGSMQLHDDLEAALAKLHGMEAAFTFSSCWAANEALFPTLCSEGDVLISDALNHASIIDGCRLVGKGVVREVYPHADLGALEKILHQHRGAKHRFIVTDGVFSMEGSLAPLPGLCDLAEKYQATLIVDDSHGVGVLGATGAGTAEHFACMPRVDIITGTLGKALGGAAGGYVAGRRHVIELLKQFARPNLFSNALPPATVGGALGALQVMRDEPQRLQRLQQNTQYFKQRLQQAGLSAPTHPSAIVPIILGDTALAIRAARALLDEGVMMTGFGYPVVPEGTARLRAQISAAHTEAQLQQAVAALGRVLAHLRA